MKKNKVTKAIISAALCTVVLGTAACSNGGGGAGSSANAKTVTFRLAFNQTEAHPQYAAGVMFGQLLSAATEGRYDVKVYPGEQLGTQAKNVDDISAGSLDMAWIAGGPMEGLNPDFIVFNLPYVFDSIESEIATLNDHDGVMADLEDSLESKNITVLTGVTAGVRNMYSSKGPIKSPADISGLKFRVQQSDSQVKMMQLMGGVPTPMGQGDTYSALQTGTIDGAENNEVTYDGMKHDEVAKYYSYTRHLIMPDYLIMSTSALNAMSETDRAALLSVIPEVAKAADDGFAAYTQTSIDHAKSIGCQFNDDVDIDAFKALLADYRDSSINNPARQKLFDGAQANNAKYPA